MRTPSGLQRRRLLQGGGAMVSLGFAAWPAAADGNSALATETFADAFAALGANPRPSTLIKLDLPSIAENGAVVPVTVSCTLPGVREIVLLVDGNPQPVAVRVSIPAGTEPFLATRIRMAASGTVYAAVRTDDGLYAASRAVEVIVGGCG